MSDTTTEMFDIYDENNNPTGITKPRDQVHKELKDWHRATHIWIINDQKQVLCQQRSMSKDSNPGKWQSFFGGHLKAGETYEQNALNELGEELGLDINKDDLKPVHILKSDKAKHFGQVYAYRWNGEVSDVKFNDGEVEQVKWMTFEEIQEMMDNEKFCNIIDKKVVEYIDKSINEA